MRRAGIAVVSFAAGPPAVHHAHLIDLGEHWLRLLCGGNLVAAYPREQVREVTWSRRPA